ncbi:hypothetical protein EDB81DRAFT_701171 [Dactylonectria macrodidyma]|uniref:Rhodopsin domain-containing protein n=1 Tax=Dactylonectria macrodidyma TaxID=307937 RepID=A0A9P9DGZ5_9HYPO|nr:hypothetical protein EDB81DRAFT_701171 [Dactylonectria macrodidyma]
MSVMTSLQVRDRLDDNRGGELKATTTVLLILATIFVALRFWARSYTAGRYGKDDWMMVVALVVVFALGAINHAEIAYGLGRHVDTLPMGDVITFFKCLLAHECIYITAVLFVKLSVLQMYLRIFGFASREFKIAAIIIASTNIAWWISIFAVCIFQCNPIRKAWLPWVEGTCINLKASFIGNAIPNILTDVVMLCMPLRQVWKMRLPLAQKLSVCFTFLLGGFVLFASIYRFTTLMQFDTRDTTWTLATACTWCVVEVACGVIGGCLPILRPLMLKVSHQFGNLTSGEEAQSGDKSQPPEVVTIGRAEDMALREERELQGHKKQGGNCKPHTAIITSTSLSKETGPSALGSKNEFLLSGGTRATVQNDMDITIRQTGLKKENESVA